jgi:hypothetical protein
LRSYAIHEPFLLSAGFQMKTRVLSVAAVPYGTDAQRRRLIQQSVILACAAAGIRPLLTSGAIFSNSQLMLVPSYRMTPSGQAKKNTDFSEADTASWEMAPTSCETVTTAKVSGEKPVMAWTDFCLKTSRRSLNG